VRKKPTDHGVLVQPEMPLGQPAEHPPEGEAFQIAECPSGHSVPKIVAPASQHRIYPVEEVSERSVLCSARQRPHLVDYGREGLLRRVGVNRLLAILTSPVAALDVPAEEIKSIVHVADPGLGN